MREHEAIIARHADKGEWTISEEKLKALFSPAEANVVRAALQTEFPDWKEAPLTIDGIRRSLKLGEALFNELPDRCILVTTDSGKDRAQLTRALVTTRIAQLEENFNKEHGKNTKRIDMMQIDAKEITDMLAEAPDASFLPYRDIRKKEGLSESEALARWLNDMNNPNTEVADELRPHESARRYRELMRILRERITSEQAPVVLFGVGHSGALAQVKYETLGREANAEDTPQFCDMFKFDAQGNLIETKGVEL